VELEVINHNCRALLEEEKVVERERGEREREQGK
jgi:hypothetical protein